MIRLDIVSDPVCPWCYIGKTQLDAALEKRPDIQLEIDWHPFQLNPDMPPEGMDRPTYLEAKFGGAEAAADTYGDIGAAAEAAGLCLDFDAIKRTPNTVDAHRLIHWAGLEGRQTVVATALFSAFFEDGRDIGDPEVLVEIAEAAGLDGAVTRRLLAGEADADMVRARDAAAREQGVRGVPAFVIAGRRMVVGSQPAHYWERLLEELAASGPAPG